MNILGVEFDETLSFRKQFDNNFFTHKAASSLYVLKIFRSKADVRRCLTEARLTEARFTEASSAVWHIVYLVSSTCALLPHWGKSAQALISSYIVLKDSSYVSLTTYTIQYYSKPECDIMRWRDATGRCRVSSQGKIMFDTFYQIRQYWVKDVM